MISSGTMTQPLSLFTLLCGMLLTLQGSPGIASETDCRVSPLQSPKGAAFTGETFTFERDVDGDGIADVVRLEKSIGSASSLIWGSLTLGASEEEIAVSHDVSFYTMVNITIVPPALVGDGRAEARLLVEDALFGMICREPDPSFSRLLDIGNPILWREGQPALPQGNYVVYFPEAPVGLIPFIGAWSELGFGGDQPVAVWVEYLGSTHAPTDEDQEENVMLLDTGFEVLAMTPRYRLLGSRHGVVAIDIATERYAWLYVFPGGHKLRWKSIDAAVFDGEDVKITVQTRQPDGVQIGTITMNLYDDKYSETWTPLAPQDDATSQQPE